MDLFSRQGEIKCTLWPDTRKQYVVQLEKNILWNKKVILHELCWSLEKCITYRDNASLLYRVHQSVINNQLKIILRQEGIFKKVLQTWKILSVKRGTLWLRWVSNPWPFYCPSNALASKLRKFHKFSYKIYLRLIRLRIYDELITNFSKSFQSITLIIWIIRQAIKRFWARYPTDSMRSFFH